MRLIGKAVLGVVAGLLAFTWAGENHAQEQKSKTVSFWDLKPDELRLLVGSGQVMARRTDQGWDAYCRCPVILRPNEVPAIVKRAVMAIEDKRFLVHGGVDWWSLPRIVTSGFRAGASTIPMQLAKNLLFHDLRGSGARGERKILEAVAALKLDGALTKEELLAAYLNQVEFGGREIVGLYRAARHYFHKEPKDLTAFEAAVLAGMVWAPGVLNFRADVSGPDNEKKRGKAFARARLVLDRMAEQGLMTPAERRLAEEVGTRPGTMPEFKIQAQAFTEWVAQTLGERFVNPNETLRFFVTLEPRYQRLAERYVADLGAEGSIPPAYEVAAVIMNGDGRVRAMVGSADWSRNQFNNAVKARVQAGSTAKLAVIVAACEAGRTPTSRVLDAPLEGDWPGHAGLGYKGWTILREAFAFSRNAAMVRLTRDLGVEKVAGTLRRLGVEPGANPDAGLALGTFSTNVLAMTGAYAAVANGGAQATPTGVLAVVDGHGRVRASFLESPPVRVVAGQCIAPVKRMLAEVVRAGTGRGAALSRWTAYGKTGTTSDNADAWFIGWSEGRVVGVWMGRRRDSEGALIAGKGPPADFFKRVSTAINEMEDYRSRRERHQPELIAGPPPVARNAAEGIPPSPAATSMHPKPLPSAQTRAPRAITVLPPPRPTVPGGKAGRL